MPGIPMKPARNCYYRKTEIDSTGSIKLLPALPDAALSKTPDYNLEGGAKANIFLMSGSIPEASHFGAGVLAGGDLVLYCSGVNTSTTGAPPSISVYNAVSGATFTEGAMELSHGWELLSSQSGSNDAGSTIITGTGSTFKTDFQPGDQIKINDDIATVAAIASDTSMTVSAVISDPNANQNLYKPRFYGNELAVYTAHADPEVTTYSEGFDGDTSLGQIKIPGYKASTPYIDLMSTDAQTLVSKLYAGGNYSVTYDIWAKIDSGTEVKEGIAYFKEYFGTNEEGTRKSITGTDQVVEVGPETDEYGFPVRRMKNVQWSKPNKSHLFLKPYDDEKPDDIWVPKHDFRQGIENIICFTPMWRWKDIRKNVKYMDYEKDDIEDNEDVTPNNTIFDAGLIYSTPNLSSFYGGGDSAGVPVNKSIIQLSTETYDDGGQSLNMYHLWSYSEMMGSIDTQYGTTGSANAQYACVGMANIPYPQVIDSAWNSMTTQNQISSSNAPITSNAAFPEVNVKFNIKEMDFVPEIHSSKVSSPTAQGGTFTDYMSANYNSASVPVNNYAENVVVSGFTSGSYDLTFRTLMRNFTICFSNYPPTEGESLDDFIHRGMKQFYSGAFTDKNEQKLYVGGMTVFRSEPKQGTIDSSSATVTAYSRGNGSNVIAMPLQTGISSYAVPIASSVTTGTALDEEQVRNRLLRYTNSTGNTAQGANVMAFAAIPANSGDGNTKGASKGYYEESVPLQMDKFVNVKFVFNPMGWSLMTTGSVADSYSSQTMCRAYFTQGVVDSSDTMGTGDTTLSTSEVTPSIPIYFPSSAFNLTATKITSFVEQPQLWPRYMTLWVTNMRQMNNTSNDATNLKGETQPWTSYTSNMVNFGFGVEEEAATDEVGSDKQTNVFVDSISMSNFTNNITNASAKAGGATQNIILDQHPMLTSCDSPDRNTSAVGNWTTPPPLGPKIREVYMPTYLLMGFKNGRSDFYNSGSTGTTQYYQMHGFGTLNRQGLTRQGKGSTTAYWSLGKHSGGTPTENAFKYFGNWPVRYYTLSGAYNTSPTKPTAITGADGSYGTLAVANYNTTYSDTLPTASDTGEFCYTSGSSAKLYTDGFTQKGFWIFGQTGATGGSNKNFNDGWVKREHPFVASKVTSIPVDIDGEINTGNAIEVDRVGIFDMPLDEEFILYKCAGMGSYDDAAYDGSTNKYVYNTIAMGSLAATGSVSNASTLIGLTRADANDYYEEGERVTGLEDYKTITNAGYIHTGAYLAFVSGGNVKEIVRVERYMVKGKSATVDEMEVSRGRMGTTPPSSMSNTNHTIEFVDPIAIRGINLAKAREGNLITFADEDVSSIITSSNLPYLYVSPWKYWQWIQFWPGAGKTGANIYGSYHALDGTDSSAKAYTGISLMKDVSATTTSTGSTYSENIYTWDSTATGTTSIGMSSPYFNTWNLLPAETGSYVESRKDFGMGAFDPETREGGQITINNALPNKPIAFNLDGYVQALSPQPSESVINKINLTTPLASSSAVFYGNDYTTTTATKGVLVGTSVVQEDVRPYYLWRYFDSLPTVSNFQVNPAFDVLSKGTDLYKLTNEQLNAVKFTWDESGDDIWYRMLIVADEPIYDKYHGLQGPVGPLWRLPLNDIPTNVLAATPVQYYDTTLVTLGTGGTITPAANARQSPTGQQGYAYDCGVSGGAGITINGSTNIKLSGAQNNWTFIVHIKSANDRTVADRTIFKFPVAAGPLTLEMGSDGRVQATFGGGTTLYSKTKDPFDGETPMMIALQFDKDGKVPRKLFVNGVLEDYSLTGTTNFTAGATTNAYIGSDNPSSESKPFRGQIEEMIFYGSSTIFFPENGGEYIYSPSTNETYEFTGEVQTVSAKLFIFDYTNIRGSSNSEVCMSPTVDWRATTA